MGKNGNLNIDKTLLETLCGYQATEGEICAVLKVKSKQLREFVKKEYNRPWAEFYEEFTARGKVKIRENQLNLSRKSADMAKYLGERYLGNTTETHGNLTAKQKAYCDFFLECNNQTKSAIKAGYKENSAKVIAAQLMTKPEIQAYLTSRRTKSEEKLEISKEKYLKKLDQIINNESPLSTESDKIQAIKVIGKWQGYEAPTKTEDITLEKLWNEIKNLPDVN